MPTSMPWCRSSTMPSAAGCARRSNESTRTMRGSTGSVRSRSRTHELRRRGARVRPLHGPVLVPLSPQMADLSDVQAGQRVLDVGCGPGALTAELVARSGRTPSRRSIRPSRSSRRPAPAIPASRASRAGRAAAVPGRSFDASLAQLVVHFMTDPSRDSPRCRGSPDTAASSPPASGITPAAREPLSTFWGAARELDPEVKDEGLVAGALGRATWSSCSRLPGSSGIEQLRFSCEPGARHLRGVVGAIHPWRRPGRLGTDGRPRRGSSGRVARPRAAPGCPRPRSCSRREPGRRAGEHRAEPTGAVASIPGAEPHGIVRCIAHGASAAPNSVIA